jgi:hypothetical protein
MGVRKIAPTRVMEIGSGPAAQDISYSRSPNRAINAIIRDENGAMKPISIL